KSNILYGMYQAKNAIRLLDECYLVEGYLDVLSLHQGGIENVVASSGTSLTEGQIKLISRYTQNVTVLYDGDAAGIKASLRGIDLILEGGLNVNVVLFPEGEDPDSYIHKVGDEAFLAYLKENTKDFISFKAELFAHDAKESPVKKAEAIKEIVHSIAKIPDNIKRSVFLKQCSLIFDIDEQVLIAEYNKIHLTAQKQQQPSHSVPPPPSEPPFGLPEAPPEFYEEEAEQEVDTQLKSLHNYEREVVRLLISYPTQLVEESQALSQYVVEQVEDVEFKNPVFARLVELCKTRIESGFLPSTEEFVNHPENDIRNAAIDLLSEKHELSEKWETHEIFVPREKDLLLYGVER
ncbi:MAG: toprim domain-containing protein, partial [Hymenobacteraceae bacterium]|nr:toprim domain-containing protein [Hymenobacteraceae bacterium]MDX5397846.1 toprim domain-containing protein [Hymenobacteraceae bacterium]MDX5513917.1 toprim domain-containing protein [Hymenobacteraceae bacterium]